MSYQSEVLTQAMYYGVAMGLGIIVVNFMQRGFFWKFFRVKTSFGKFILVKLKSVDKDKYAVGIIEEGFLVYKHNKGVMRIPVPGNEVLYRSLGITWTDFNEITKEFNKPDFSKVSSYDPDKTDSLLERAIFRPAAVDTMTKVLILLVVIAIIAGLAAAFVGFRNMQMIQAMQGQLGTMIKGAVVAGAA